MNDHVIRSGRAVITLDGSTRRCDTYWGSHGCYLPQGHSGDALSHVCDPCTQDCPSVHDPDDCDEHCNNKPHPGYIANQYGDDAKNFASGQG